MSFKRILTSIQNRTTSKNTKEDITVDANPKIDQPIMCDHIYSNDYLRLISDACAICWDKTPPTEPDKQIEYISKRVKTGHTSIIEHSNIVLLVKYNESNPRHNKDVLEFLSANRYLIIKKEVSQSKLYGDNKDCLLIGGSLRAYFDIFDRTIDSVANTEYNLHKNMVTSAIINCFQLYSYRDLFIKYIENNMIKDNFTSTENVVKNLEENMNDSSPYKNTNKDYSSLITIGGMDSLFAILNELNRVTDMKRDNPYEYLEYATITVLFKNMSRTCTHQLVRHRNAITQESQRYVDYSDAKFINPADFRDTLKDQKYAINFAGYRREFTLEELGKELCGIYEQLLNAEENPLRREEARSFLPSNVACNKLYMTFNLLKLFKFFELRTDRAAQAEIRMFATDLLKFYTYAVTNTTPPVAPVYDTKYLLPRIMRNQLATYEEVDEPVE